MVCGQSRKPLKRKELEMSSQTNQNEANAMSTATRRRLEQQLGDPQISDELNPTFVFQMTATDILLAIAGGLLDPVELAKKELASRGLDANGKWAGFDRAREIWEVK